MLEKYSIHTDLALEEKSDLNRNMWKFRELSWKRSMTKSGRYESRK